jgi:hypothetical protein
VSQFYSRAVLSKTSAQKPEKPMDRSFKTPLAFTIALLCAASALAQATPHYLIANDNNPDRNFATFFTIGADVDFN